MSRLYPNLDWALGSNKGLRREVTNVFSLRNSHLASFEKLIEYLRTSGCGGIREKIGDCPDWYKLKAVQSELEFAREMIMRGSSVELLPDASTKGDVPKKGRPDIVCRKDSRELVIQVTRIGSDKTAEKVFPYLRDFLDDMGLEVCVKLDPALSETELDKDGRKERDSLIDSSLEQFRRYVCGNGLENLPFTFKAESMVFEVQIGESGKKLRVIDDSGLFGADGSEDGDYIVERIAWKANEWQNYSGEYQGLSWFIAIDSHNCRLHSFLIESALYGRDENGAFYEEPAMKCVDGLLFRSITGHFYVYPNPCCEGPIDTSELCRAFGLSNE